MKTRSSTKKLKSDSTADNNAQENPKNQPDRDTESDNDVDLLPKSKVPDTTDPDSKSTLFPSLSNQPPTMYKDEPAQRDQDHYSTMNFMLKMPGVVAGSIQPLKENGSNFIAWKDDLWVAVDGVTKTPKYFEKDRSDVPGDDNIVRMLRLSVHPDLRIQLDTTKSAYEVFTTLKSMFHFQSRSTHISLWKEILEAKVDSPSEVTAHITKIKSKVEELQRTGFTFTKDTFLSVAMQLGLSANFSAVNTVLDSRLRITPDIAVTARETEEAIRNEAHRLVNSAPDLLPNLSALSIRDRTPQYVARPRPQPSREPYRPPMKSSQSQTPSKPSFQINENTPPHLRTCFDCGGDGHWANTPKCPRSPNYRPEMKYQTSSRAPVRANFADVDQGYSNSTPLPHSVYTSEGALTEDWDEGNAILDSGATHHVTNEESDR